MQFFSFQLIGFFKKKFGEEIFRVITKKNFGEKHFEDDPFKFSASLLLVVASVVVIVVVVVVVAADVAAAAVAVDVVVSAPVLAVLTLRW